MLLIDLDAIIFSTGIVVIERVKVLVWVPVVKIVELGAVFIDLISSVGSLTVLILSLFDSFV